MQNAAIHATQSRATDLASSLLSQLSEELAQGNSEALTQYLSVMARFHSYSFYNSLLIFAQRKSATHVAGYQRWRQLDRWVKAGEKGITILAPCVGRRKPEMAEDNRDECGRESVRYFVAVHVFDVSQTDGKPLPEIARVTGEPGDYVRRLKALIGEKGIGLAYTANLDGARGLSHGGDITVLTGLEPAEELQVLAHELGHELLHRGTRRVEMTRQIRELEAEAVAYVVTRACGLENNGASMDYVHLYKGDEKLLSHSLAHIQRAAADILDYILVGGIR